MNDERGVRLPENERTLEANEIADAIRRPSFEMQQAALAAGYGSVRDWALTQCIEEIKLLKGRVDALEAMHDA